MRGFDFLAHAVRAKEIFYILARNGFGDVLHKAGAPTRLWKKMLPEPTRNASFEERVRITAEQLGPAFIKFGQLLSMRPEMLPQSLVLELRKLQDHVRPLPFEEMRPVLDEGLGKPHSAVFDEFDETPAASASLGQVYRGRLRSNGRLVAVKVLRPGISRTMAIDLDLAAWLAGQLHHRSEALRPYDLPGVVEEVRKAALLELDYRNEARNQRYFNAVNPYPDRVFAPGVVDELSSERVLVSDWVEGVPVSSPSIPTERRPEIAAHGAESLVHQVLIDGFFHADPHAGNVIVTPDARLAFIDWGQVGHLTPRLRHALAEFWLAAIDQDSERIVRIAADLGPSDARPDFREMEKELTIALREDLNFAVGSQQLGRAMLRLLNVLGRNGIPLSRDYSLMAKAVLSIEEVGRTLDPEFDLRQHARPAIEQLEREPWKLKSLLHTAAEFAKAGLAGLKELPSEARRLIRRLDRDNLTINFQHKGLEGFEETVKTSANRITLGLIVGALIIGSSLIVVTEAGPRLFGYPALGLFGFVISGLFGLYVVVEIIRHGKHK